MTVVLIQPYQHGPTPVCTMVLNACPAFIGACVVVNENPVLAGVVGGRFRITVDGDEDVF